MEQKAIQKNWKIVMLPRLQVDAIVSCFLLQYFGDELFPGIKDAEYLFWVDLPEGKNAAELEAEGYILLDIGKGRFDHHVVAAGMGEQCMSEIVAKHLDVNKKPAIKKLIEYARRDDLEGRGTISKDPIDRAFGLSGLVNNLNRSLPDDQASVLRTVMPLLVAHYLEEKKRAEDLPAEYQEKIASGKASELMLQTPRGPVKAAMIETDEIAMAGYLRAQRGIDIVMQKMSSGHVNIITQQKKMFDLSLIARFLRIAEAEEKGTPLTVTEEELSQPGRVAGIEEWYFDARARTIQNGGIRPQWTKPTGLSLATVAEIVRQAAAIKL
jgi:hypothetical protein